jgi:FlaG/FlaF family flagellin (archaellin)
MREPSFCDSADRAVSDVVAFVLVFALVITAVGLVTTVGFGSLQDVTRSEQAKSAEIAFDAVAETVTGLERGTAPVRSSEVSLSDGSMSVVEGATIEVRVDPDDSDSLSFGSSSYDYTYTTGGIEYRSADTRFTYESGTVYRGGADGSVLRASPSMTCEGDTAVVSLVDVRADGSGGVAGGSTTVVSRATNRSVLYSGARHPDTQGVQVAVTSQGQEAWNEHFAESAGWTGSSGTYTCSAERVFVRLTVVEVRFR